MSLSLCAVRGSLDDLLQATLDRAEALTESKIGFFHLVDADQENLTLQVWSANTLATMCTAEGKHAHYPIASAGVWVDCFHARAPVIHNDYASLPNRKGMPEGHAEVVRELIVPVIRDGLVTAIIGLGNKETDYVEADVAIVESLVSLTMDAMDRKRAQAALAESEARFRGLFEGMAQGVVYQLADGRVTAANPAALRILGLTGQEAKDGDPLGMGGSAFREDGSPMPPDEHPAAIAVHTGREVRDVVVGLDVSGRRVWLRANAVPTFHPGETKAYGAFVTFEDISERKQMQEERLRAVHRELRLQRLEGFSALAGGIAHDFNNLLTAMIGFTEMASASLDPTAEARADLAQVLEAGKRASELCRQMLAISGKRLFATTPISLAELTREAAPALAAGVPSGVMLVLPGPEDGRDRDSVVSGDRRQLRRILENLVANAAEALVPRGGRIRVGLGRVDCSRAELDGFVQGEMLKPGAYGYVEVDDDGPGMDVETLARIFDPFFSTKFVGRGLGLPEALGIARAHAGSLRVVSAPNGGTSVRLIVPAADAPAAARADPPRVSTSPNDGRRAVLFVDDEATLRAMARRTLERAAYRVLFASDGREALEVYQRHSAQIALVVLDLTMPVLDGESTLAELRRLDPDVRVLLSSGYSARDVELRFAGRGVAAFLSKPYTPSELEHHVRALID